MNKLQNLSDKLQTVMQEVQAQALDAVKEAMKEVFDAEPDIAEISWKQYTPYFNDGDPCEFSVGAPYVKFKDATAVKRHLKKDNLFLTKWDDNSRERKPVREYTDEELINNGVEGDGFYDTYYLKKTSSVRQILDTLYDGLSGIEMILQGALGDHIQVTCSPKEITTEEYDHD